MHRFPKTFELSEAWVVLKIFSTNNSPDALTAHLKYERITIWIYWQQLYTCVHCAGLSKDPPMHLHVPAHCSLLIVPCKPKAKRLEVRARVRLKYLLKCCSKCRSLIPGCKKVILIEVHIWEWSSIHILTYCTLTLSLHAKGVYTLSGVDCFGLHFLLSASQVPSVSWSALSVWQ